MSQKLIDQIDEQAARTRSAISHLQAALDGLTKARDALAGEASAQVGANAFQPREPKRRAPAGFLESAVEIALSEKPERTNGEIRAMLRKSGYAFSIAAQHLGKRLSAMVDAKRLVVVLKGSERRYSLAKSKS